MLYYETIEPKTLELLMQLQSQSAFSQLRLVGGTSLALQLGHRKSVDIDLFGKLNIDKYELDEILRSYASIKTLRTSKNINIYLLNGIKVDIVNYSYKWLFKPISIDGLFLADIKDIAAMKLSAITGRGGKKDFIDLYFILQKYKLDEIINFYNKKYPDGSEFLLLKSLAYFDDAEQDEKPYMIKDIKWKQVKQFIKNELNKYLIK
ncbi:MAG: hypothetical protein DRJ01_16865 [Bacteroidetes bacterium]|nr:MAG: hypothetical protein DRJ01_16865 [Bacteroidota bacterium]